MFLAGADWGSENRILQNVSKLARWKVRREKCSCRGRRLRGVREWKAQHSGLLKPRPEGRLQSREGWFAEDSGSGSFGGTLEGFQDCPGAARSPPGKLEETEPHAILQSHFTNSAKGLDFEFRFKICDASWKARICKVQSKCEPRNVTLKCHNAPCYLTTCLSFPWGRPSDHTLSHSCSEGDGLHMGRLQRVLGGLVCSCWGLQVHRLTGWLAGGPWF